MSRSIVNGDAQSLHRIRPVFSDAIHVALLRPTMKCVVFGSSQRELASRSHAALVRAGYESAVRDSGGGAVVVGPEMQLWFGVYERYSAEVSTRPTISTSLISLGRRLQEGLRALGAPPGEVVTTPTPRSQVDSLICFAGTSYGEILVDGGKLVGISQRRTRDLVISHVMILREPTQHILFELFSEMLGDERGVPQATLREYGVVTPTPSDTLSLFGSLLDPPHS
ncbi:MAG: lipoyl protein ligase domain-containing protein [Acidimicrobiales bacterium]